MARADGIALVLGCALAACTPGGTLNATASSGFGGGSMPGIINANLTSYPASSTSAGNGGGYAPVMTTLSVGSTVRFTNTDSFAHTASALIGATTFPAASPLTSSAQTPSGTMLSGAWSSGTLQAGATSQPITVDKSGTYLYGCFFHYGAPMRGEIVAL